MTAMVHICHFIRGSNPAKPPLVLLHGSGGDEHEIVPLAANLAPGSPILAVRGGIPFDGGFAFFHRFQDRSIDEADIASRTVILADFIEAASRPYGLSKAPIAIGFSKWSHHGSGSAPDAPTPAGGCRPVPTSLALPR